MAALLLPAESILLQALATPNEREAVRAWVRNLSADELGTAADNIQSYPFAYRREIMRALAPADRAAVWRDHIQTYLATHPGLDGNAENALNAALTLATPRAFADPTADDRAQIDTVAEQVKTLLGAEEAKFLFYRLGPPDQQTASVEPLAMRLSNAVRRMFVALADAEDCDCNVGFGCDGVSTVCREGTGCNVDDSWPACGWFWNQTCDGLCFAGIEG
jgi:hypothetical protein